MLEQRDASVASSFWMSRVSCLLAIATKAHHRCDSGEGFPVGGLMLDLIHGIWMGKSTVWLIVFRISVACGGMSHEEASQIIAEIRCYDIGYTTAYVRSSP